MRTLQTALLMVAVYLYSDCALAKRLSLAHTFPVESAVDNWAHDFQTCVSDSTGDYVDVIPSGMIGGAVELAGEVFSGQLDMAIVPAWAASNFWPPAAALALPGVMSSPQTIKEYSNSEPFLESIEDVLARQWPVNIMGIGWRHAMLVSAQTGIHDLTGSRVLSYSSAVSSMLEELGARSVAYKGFVDYSALTSGQIDAMFVGVEAARSLVDENIARSIFFDDSFLPFKEAQLMVLSRRATEDLGTDIVEQLRSECGGIADQYNQWEVDSLMDVASRARSMGVALVPLRSGNEWQWETATDAAWRAGAVSSLGAVEEVLAILRKYD